MTISAPTQPADLLTALERDRPHDGQPWTLNGARGAEVLDGITGRDLKDAFIIACYLASGLSAEDYPTTLYQLPWDDIDPLAVVQSMGLVLERRAGITFVPPSGKAVLPSACIWCSGDFPTACHFHDLGDQAPRRASA